MKKKILSLLLTLLLLLTNIPAVWAAETPDLEVLPAASEPLLVETSCAMDGARDLTIYNEYVHSGIRINRVVVNTYIERKSGIGTWVRLDIGTADNQWTDYSSQDSYCFSHSITLPAAGTYRVTARFRTYEGRTLLDDVTKTPEFTI